MHERSRALTHQLQPLNVPIPKCHPGRGPGLDLGAAEQLNPQAAVL